MELEVKIKMNEKLFLRDPEETALGRKIVRDSIHMIHELGFEDFTFKKLAARIDTTEASVYRYFENKHRLLVYINAWYWGLLEYSIELNLRHIRQPEQKIKRLIELLLNESEDSILGDLKLKNALYHIAIRESNKAYLTREVTENNKARFYKPYKDLCGKIADLFLSYNPQYPFSRSLASTLIEAAHFQLFFMQHLPSLTDFGHEKDSGKLKAFLESLVFSSIRKRK